ncbi:MAG: OB-fold nucleic acid binding domain-containing protein, partial [candidate division WOR-3 bacterium]
MDETLDQVKFRKEHLDELKKKGINSYPYKFERSHTAEELKGKFESLENKEVSAAGRVMRIRSHGKSSFFDIQDSSDFVQIYLSKDALGDDYEIVGLLDIGDFIGVKGKLMKTRTGEVTILVEELTVLAKSLHPLPEKWHGLSDREDRYRKRYLDLIANKESEEVFRKRTLIIQEIRKF